MSLKNALHLNCLQLNHSFCCSQLFWEKKLSGLSAYDIAEELVKTMELPKGLQGKTHTFHNVSSD